ncbi:flagellar assembly protein FliH [Bacillus massiliigorillae]|uniref:flagellar assembly protein FliH n=1 Tax=Bacillus massiliigorillae TaxID=1243664 RepID=UPI0003A4EC18|nr:flagellar assembly protein FliH [Bacillus massiliigorillae]
MSRIIKSPWTKNESTEGKVIEIKTLHNFELTSNEQEEEKLVVNQIAIDEILQKANGEAEKIIQVASEQADTIKAEIEAEKQHWHEVERRLLEEDARKVGYDDGYTMGKQQGYEEMHGEIEHAKGIVELSKQDYQNYLQSSEETILELAVHIAEKIINTEIVTSEDAFLSIVKKVIKEAREYREVRLIVHPNKYEYLLLQKEELLGIFPKETDFYIFPDDEIKETSCIIESANGRIDASIDSQLNELKQKLIEIMEGE